MSVEPEKILENVEKEVNKVIYAPRKKNWISGVDNEYVAVALGGAALLIGVGALFRDPLFEMYNKLTKGLAPPMPVNGNGNGQGQPVQPQIELPMLTQEQIEAQKRQEEEHRLMAEIEARKQQQGQQPQQQFSSTPGIIVPNVASMTEDVNSFSALNADRFNQNQNPNPQRRPRYTNVPIGAVPNV